MIAEYEAFSHKTFDGEAFLDCLKKKKQEAQETERQAESREKAKEHGKKRRPKIGILGARANEKIKEILREKDADLVFDLTCTGLTERSSLRRTRS